MNLKHKFLLLFLLPLHLYGQIDLKGNIIDSVSKTPIEFATIYINGTMNRTISNSEGMFTLNMIKFPCQIIINHVGYVTKMIEINNSGSLNINIGLSQKVISIDEVIITDKNMRENNLRLFKEQFLGMDKWGKQAVIENDEVLRFDWTYITRQFEVNKNHPHNYNNFGIKDVKWSKDSSSISFSSPSIFKVSAREPLKISLPSLGYKLQVDLIDFSFQYNKDLNAFESQFLGYYYYQSFSDSKKAIKKINRNRLKVYYNSSMHFCRSLYEKKLKENGYRIFEKIINVDTTKNYTREINFDSSVVFTNETVQLIGYNNRKFYIFYYGDFRNNPIDVTKTKGRNPIQSQMFCINELCTILANGTIPDNSIIFSPLIGSKSIGASLPADYKPSDN